ncbi:MAG: glucose-6-phosphate dehydrogenase [Gammaproteobacteria bacterium]|nr:glucose-6-phosphate dehydrogenase [Gammaproteobacteria bacterium]MDH3449447.1 glucose-6-phosphate dehydrogenase [Gammaproteobacteria bacterium]
MNTVSPFDLVIFGGTGDLAARKLIPALYHRHCAEQLPQQARIIALGRRNLSRDAYLEKIFEKSRAQISNNYFKKRQWKAFTSRIEYQQLDAASDADFANLAEYLRDAQERVRIFYLSTSPDLFSGICERLAHSKLVKPNSRVVLEKPLGRDLHSADLINACVESVFSEKQIYRIDHYLGKEAVQNLMALRFGNSIFEPLWSHGKIRDVQITLAEQIGVEGRGEFYDKTGTLRDMVQNHLMQLLCIVAMEPPISMDADNVRDEKLKVIRSLQRFSPKDVLANTVRGQYRAGKVDGGKVPGYLDEPGIAADSRTETFVALRARINNWRWSGVPFFLRTGKRMHEQVGEVVINFYSLPHAIFPVAEGSNGTNRLYIRLQPQESIELHLMAKQAGDRNILKPVKLDLDLTGQNERHLDAYERLLMDVVRGNQTLFVRRDELNAAWQWVEPIMKVWESSEEAPDYYDAGTSGPESARNLIARNRVRWIEDV